MPSPTPTAPARPGTAASRTSICPTCGPCGPALAATARLAAPEVLLQRFRQDPAPAILGAQLLRTSHQGLEEAGDPPQCRDHRTPPPVARRHRQPRLTGVMGLTCNPVQQERPAGDRLAVVIGIRQPHEQAPPVVDERDQPRHVLAAFQVPRGEAAPAPLVLQLVEAVLRVSPVPVELGERTDLKIERRRQNRELPNARARLRVGPEQIALAVSATVPGSRRRSTTTRRVRLQLCKRSSASIPDQPCPASSHSSRVIRRSASRRAPFIRRSLNR